MTDKQDKTEQEAWTMDRELRLFRRVQHLLDEVPIEAWSRVREYLGALVMDHRPTEPERIVVSKGLRPVDQAQDKEWRGTGAER